MGMHWHQALSGKASVVRHTPGMAFKVWIVDEKPADCGDGDMYEFLAGGILAIHYSTPGRWSDYYQPTVWRRVAAQPNHRPGEPADTSIGPDFD